MINWFTSDTHLGHANIIKYCKRPYNDVVEMDNALIDNWNILVSPEDHVYHLGDFAYGDVQKVWNYIRRLNGIIHIIWGNHDKGLKQLYKYSRHLAQGKVFFLHDMAEVTVEKQTIILNHYAMRIWNKSHHESWHLYGHSHGTLPDDPHSRSFDVGVDCHQYRPISFREVGAIMRRKAYKPVDYHGTKEDGDT